MSDYSVVPGGALKFKARPESKNAQRKKKKSSSHTTTTYEKKDAEVAIAESSKRAKATARKGSDSEGESRRKRKGSEEREASAEKDKPKSSGGRQMTEAEKKFEEIQRRRRVERVAKTANMSHKDRVQEFNSKLDKLTEHNDIPKISWTG